MAIGKLDHVNVRTGHLAEMIDFYHTVLGFEPGERPPFSFNGAWMYSGGHPFVHLVEVAEPPQTVAPRLEHFAFQGERLGDFLAHLRQHRVPYRIGLLPAFDTRQVNIHDPDGNHIHIDFQPHEQADLSDYDGA